VVEVDELAVGGGADLQPGQRPGRRGHGQVGGEPFQRHRDRAAGRARAGGRGEGCLLGTKGDLEAQGPEQVAGALQGPLVVREAAARSNGLAGGAEPTPAALVSGYQAGFLAAATLCLLGLVAALRLPRPARR
jgi:hypothetical protein